MHKLFTLASGRTGTHFLAHVINAGTDNALARAEEPPAFLRRGYQLVARDSTMLDRLRFRLSRDRFMRTRPDAAWFVETNNRLFSAADSIIRRVYPSARIYHIVRDGRDVVASWLNRGRYFPADPGLRLTPEMVPGDPHRDCWQDMNPLQKAAWNWATVHRIIDAQHPDARFRFEDLTRPPFPDLYRLLDSLEGLRYERDRVAALASQRINPNRTALFPPYPRWPDDWKAQFWEIAGETMARFGYTEDGYGQARSPGGGRRPAMGAGT